jgi:predicted HAD superfamily Cof-like phosphohydrolase
MNYPVAEDGTVLYNHGITVHADDRADRKVFFIDAGRTPISQVVSAIERVMGERQSNFVKVGQFMTAMDQPVLTKPQFPDGDSNTDEKGLRPVAKLRIDLIREEFDELRSAIVDDDIVGIADALTDILYVVYGAGHAYGIDLDACFNEVHESNMTKLGPDGKAIKNENGKVMKPATYRPPNLQRVLGLE